MSGGRTDWLARVNGIRQWSRRGERAPHKPLLLLYVLGAMQREGRSRITYPEAEQDLKALLAAYGPNRATTPAYPFWYLQSDELWRLDASGNVSGPNEGQLKNGNATGELVSEFEHALRTDPSLLGAIAKNLLAKNWPASLHDEIAAAAGLDLESLDEPPAFGAGTRDAGPSVQRDPAFRAHVLMAYRYRCAFCGYDRRLNTGVVGLDAAHVRWRAFAGPDTVDNGMALCVAHHRLFDLGIMGLSDERQIIVSPLFVGDSDAAKRLVDEYQDQPVSPPRKGEPEPDEQHVSWHLENVFKHPTRVEGAG